MIKIPRLLVLSLYFILFFVLFYFEPLSIGGIKFSILWKLPLVTLLAIYFVLTIVKKQAVFPFIFFGLLLSLKFFFSISSLHNLPTTISEFIKFSVFFFLFYYLRHKFEIKTLLSMGKYLAIFIIISFIPFMLGYLTSLGKSIDISKYGNISGNSLTGIFQNPHAAGIVLAFALLIIFYSFLTEINNKNKLIFLGLVLLGFIELSLIMVRTSLAMFILGAIYLSYRYLKIKNYLLIILPLIIGFIIYLPSIYQNSVMLQSMTVRLQGDTKYSDFEDVGSGRYKFASIAIDSWKSEGVPGIVIGLGMELGKDKMGAAIGSRLLAHNGFIQILQSEGIVGFILLLLYMFFLFKFIIKYKRDKIYPLVLSLFGAYLISYYFQGGNYFLLYVLFAIYLAAISKGNSQFSSRKHKII